MAAHQVIGEPSFLHALVIAPFAHVCEAHVFAHVCEARVFYVELTAAHMGSIGFPPYLGKKEHSGVTFGVYVFREDKLQ